MILGMGASSAQRGSVVSRCPRGIGIALRHAGGGLLIETGAALVPGGIDTLLLNALPNLARRQLRFTWPCCLA